jgi:hypothetical protein
MNAVNNFELQIVDIKAVEVEALKLKFEAGNLSK